MNYESPCDTICGIWKPEWCQVNGQTKYSPKEIWYFGDGLLVENHRRRIRYEYAIDGSSDPMRIRRTSELSGVEQTGIIRLDGNSLIICESSGIFEPSGRVPSRFETLSGDGYHLSHLSKIEANLADFRPADLTILVREHFGSPPERRDIDSIRTRQNRFDNDAKRQVRQIKESIYDKIEDGEDMILWYRNKASSKDKVVCSVFWLMNQVDNGGWYQYLLSSTGRIAVDTLGDLESIAASETAAILKRALSVFTNQKPPESDQERRQQLNELRVDESELLIELNDLYYNRSEDLNRLILQLVAPDRK